MILRQSSIEHKERSGPANDIPPPLGSAIIPGQSGNADKHETRGTARSTVYVLFGGQQLSCLETSCVKCTPSRYEKDSTIDCAKEDSDDARVA